MSINAKSALLEELALVTRALASPARLRILEQLAQGERSVEALAQKTELTVANCSQHLQQLRRGGLVTSRRDGKAVIYRLSDPDIVRLMDMLFEVARRNLNEVDRILRGLSGGGESPEPIGREELAARMREGSVTLLDVRPSDEYAAQHIQGAVNAPLAEIGLVAGRIDPGAEVVAYCRGPFCIYAHEAVAALRGLGINARPLDGGLPEWREDGRPVAGSAATA